MMHPSTHEYLKPSDKQMMDMNALRDAAARYQEALEKYVPDGPDKTYAIRQHRTTAMWANVAVTRQANGTPRV